MSRIGTIETHDRIIFILDPDSPDKSALGALGWSHVEDESADFAEKLTAHVVELVVLGVEAAVVEINHLQKPVRQELRAEIKKPSQAGDDDVTKGGIVTRFERT